MGYKRKQRILRIIRRSALTGKAVWLSHDRTYKVEWEAYKRACNREVNRMRQWAHIVGRRQTNIMRLLNQLTGNLPIIGDIPISQRDAAKAIARIADKEPPKQSNFYDHIKAERRQRENARKRLKRWREKHETQSKNNSYYDK